LEIADGIAVMDGPSMTVLAALNAEAPPSTAQSSNIAVARESASASPII
jgi:hypothetical protein